MVVLMRFFKKETKEEEKKEPVAKNFTLKLKQDRYKNWICESARVQGDTIEEIKERMEELLSAVISKTREINGDDDE
jgi:hypothetical protein